MPSGFTAAASCRAGGIGLTVAGTGTAGTTVTFVAISPYQWYYSQPGGPITVTAGGTWSVLLEGGSPSWYPFTATLHSSDGGTADVAVNAC